MEKWGKFRTRENWRLWYGQVMVSGILLYVSTLLWVWEFCVKFEGINE